jgi:ABC-type nickel/cobalt efflux system permease component RcnA
MNNKKTTQITNLEECWPCPVLANYTLAFVLQLREKHGKPSVRVAEEIQSIHIVKTPAHYKTHPHTYTHTHTHTHITKQIKTTTVQIKTNTVQDITK